MNKNQDGSSRHYMFRVANFRFSFYRAFTFLFVILLLCSSSYAQSPFTLFLDFSNSFNGVDQDGNQVVPRLSGNPERVAAPLIGGMALKSGPTTGYLYFPTANILYGDAGTVSMWVYPVDWGKTDTNYHWFFEANSSGGLLSLYKHWPSIYFLSFKTGKNQKGPYNLIDLKYPSKFYSSGIPWEMGVWHHIAVSWTPLQQSIYVNGQLKGSIPTVVAGLPEFLSTEFFLGDTDKTRTPVRPTTSLLTDVMICDRALSDEHIYNLYAGLDAKIPIATANSFLDFSVDTTANQLTAYFETGGDTLAGDSVNFTLTPRGSSSSSGIDQPLVRGMAKTQFSTTGLTPGDYNLRATVFSGGAPDVALVQPVFVPDVQSWMGNTLGLLPQIPPPWTALVVAASPLTVSCWGRTYQFGEWPLPVQIISKGEALLAKPMELKIIDSGQPLVWSQGSVNVVTSLAEAVDLEGTAVSGGVTLRTKMHIEYDGMMLLDVSLEGTPITVQSISLNIPLRPQTAVYQHRQPWGLTAWNQGLTGYLRANPPFGIIDHDIFRPYVWIGDNDRGLLWFCETGQYWPNFASQNAYELERQSGEITMRFNLLNGQALPSGWKYQCGLQATPVKPLPKGWRKWRHNPMLIPGYGNFDITFSTKDPHAPLKYFGFPEPSDPGAFNAWVDDLHSRGMKMIPYSYISASSWAVPEWPWFKNDWRMGLTGFYENTEGSPFQQVNPTSQSFSDFIIWKNKQFMDQSGVDGYIHDQMGSVNSPVEPPAGAAWRDSYGILRGTFPILAYRKLARRLYNMVKTTKPDSLLIAHGDMTMPIMSHEDALLSGEFLWSLITDSYNDVIPLDRFRAMFMGRQWGLAPFFLPKFTAPYVSEIKPTRGLMAMLMLHDVTIFGSYNVEEANKAYDALNTFGYINSEFIPYFDSVPPGTTDMQDVYVSVYKRPDGNALAIVGNVSTDRTDKTGLLRLNGARLGSNLNRVISWPDGTPLLRVSPDTFQLDVQERGYRMVFIENLNAAPAVKISSPAYGESFQAPAKITITAAAADADGTVVRMDFFKDGIYLGADISVPYIFSWTNVAAGSYNLTARATDNYMKYGFSSTIKVKVVVSDTLTNQPPSCGIGSPGRGEYFAAGANITLQANASDSDGTVSRVDFFQDGTYLGADMSPPYTFSWTNAPAGSYGITARATDNQGAIRTSDLILCKVYSNVTNSPPEVKIQGPNYGEYFIAPANITLYAQAADSDGIHQVEFFKDGVSLLKKYSSPYTCTLTNVAAGSYVIAARAMDKNWAERTSLPLLVKVYDAADVTNQPPVVSIVSPANNAVFTAPATITVQANASDSDGIHQVEFFKDGVLLLKRYSSPYTCTLTNVAAGSYVIAARAMDNQGAIRTAMPIRIKVQ